MLSSDRLSRRLASHLLACIFVAGCLVQWMLPIPAFSQAFHTYFNNPDDQNHEYDIQDAFLDEIGSATSTVDLTIYNINSGTISDALLDWHDGSTKTLRMASDVQPGETNHTTYIAPLVNDGAAIEYDTPESYSMHDKFAVIGGSRVWTGSWNLTAEASTSQWNNAIVIDDYWLRQAYESEFSQMLGVPGTLYDGSFHQNKSQVAGTFALGGGTADDLYRMSPQNDTGDTTEDLIVAEIDATIPGDTIHFAIFTFTSEAISEALRNAAASGVTVRGIFDKAQADGGASTDVYDDLQEAGCDVFWLSTDPGQTGSPYIHHKYMVINPLGTDPVVVTGSANFTAAAMVNKTGGNDENTLILS